MPPRVPKRRPALWSAICLALGILIADQLAPPLWLWLGAVGGLAPLAAVGLAVRRAPMATVCCLLLLVAAAGGLRYHQCTRLLPAHHIALAADGARGVLMGRLVGEPETAPGDEGSRVRGLLAAEAWRPEGQGARPVTGAVWVTLYDVETTADAGDRLWLQTRLRRPSPARNPGAFDFRRFLALQGVHATASIYRASDLRRLQPLPATWWRQGIVLPVRRAVRVALEAHLSGAPAGLARGMLLGEKHRIPTDVADRFRHAGLAHALVISGLHVGLVALFFHTGFRVARVPSRAACLATAAVLLAYALVTDLQAPVVRASIMAGTVLAGRAIGRRGEVYNGLGLAALIILALWPTSLLTLSFQLSFGATGAIVSLHRPLMAMFPATWRDEGRALGKWVLAPTCVTLAAQLGTGPLIAYHFQQFAPVSLVANLVVVPLLGLSVSLGLLTALTGAWLPAAATAFSGANYLALSGLIWMVDGFAGLPGASLTTPKPALHTLALAGGGAWLLASVRRRPRARCGLLLLALTWANLSVWTHVLRRPELEVVFLDVGQGDGVFVRFPNGRTMVVDGGLRSRRIDFGERVLVPYLRQRGVDRVDVVVASHPHSDHIGGLVHLLAEVEVHHFLDSGQDCDTWTSRRLHELIEARGIVHHRVAAGDSLVGLGGAGGLVLHPTAAFVDAAGASVHGLNNGSVVLRLDYRGTRVLLTGDIERDTDAALLGWGERLRADVLKAAHHGSQTSSSPAFLAGVDPALVVVSVGAFNKFRHPAPEIIERFVQRGAAVYRTDGCGAVALRVNDTGERRLRVMVPEECGATASDSDRGR